MMTGQEDRERIHNPHVQQLRVPNVSEIDFGQLRAGRLERLQRMMRAHDMPVAMFYNPANIRYATGTEVMGVWTGTTFARYCLVPAEGEPVLFEYANSMHVSQKIMSDVRPAQGWQFRGVEGLEPARRWAASVADTMRELGVAGERLAVDRLDGFGFMALADAGIEIGDASPATVDAREVKTPEEIQIMVLNGGIGDAMLADFEAAIRPGVREYELMAVVNETLYRCHGEFMFTRLIASGPNTNPWMSEAHDKIVQPGDLVGIDTDANTYEGYVVDISRTFLCGDNALPRPEGGIPDRLRLRERHARAHEAGDELHRVRGAGAEAPGRVSRRALRRHGAPGGAGGRRAGHSLSRHREGGGRDSEPRDPGEHGLLPGVLCGQGRRPLWRQARGSGAGDEGRSLRLEHLSLRDQAAVGRGASTLIKDARR